MLDPTLYEQVGADSWMVCRNLFDFARLTALIGLVEIIFWLLGWLATNPVISLRDEASTATVFNFEKALVAVGHVVGATNGIEVGWANLLASTERKSL